VTETNIHFSVNEDRPLAPWEIEQEQKWRAEMTTETSWRNKPTYVVMNRAYLKGLRHGETRREAKQSAAHAAGVLNGVILGVVFTLLFVGFLGWAYDVAQTASTINTIIAVCVWITIFALGLSWTRRKIVALYRRLRRKDKT